MVYHTVYAFALPTVYGLFLMALVLKLKQLGWSSSSGSAAAGREAGRKQQRYLS
jgi:hypothetical protein